jgi:hypothetical protein
VIIDDASRRFMPIAEITDSLVLVWMLRIVFFLIWGPHSVFSSTPVQEITLNQKLHWYPRIGPLEGKVDDGDCVWGNYGQEKLSVAAIYDSASDRYCDAIVFHGQTTSVMAV